MTHGRAHSHGSGDDGPDASDGVRRRQRLEDTVACALSDASEDTDTAACALRDASEDTGACASALSADHEDTGHVCQCSVLTRTT